MKTFENPQLWYDTEFLRQLEIEVYGRVVEVFEEVQTSSLTDAQLDTVISARWVMVRTHDGTVGCRRVVSGFDQVKETDGTFASTPSLKTLKLLLTLSVAFGWRISTFDISTAFLHALITTEGIFVIPPLEFAPWLWQDHFASVMKTNNFKRMKCDPNLTVLNSFSCVLCYVDDLMVFGSDSDVFQLAQVFSLPKIWEWTCW